MHWPLFVFYSLEELFFFAEAKAYRWVFCDEPFHRLYTHQVYVFKTKLLQNSTNVIIMGLLSPFWVKEPHHMVTIKSGTLQYLNSNTSIECTVVARVKGTVC